MNLSIPSAIMDYTKNTGVMVNVRCQLDWVKGFLGEQEPVSG